MARASAIGPQGDPKGLYSTLGVPKDAEVAEIRKAYRRLALRWHPDKNPDNPEATAEFQKISSAYEVLSDGDRRKLYDTTGCLDEEELGGEDLDRFQDLFAAFFTGSSDDLDADEQGMLDEFLRMAGHGAFMRGKGKKGRRRGGGGRARAEEQLLGDLFKAMSANLSDPIVPTCPQGHALKRRKAEGDYECDGCGRDILEGKRVFDCRRCDFTLCQRCHKEAQEAESEGGEEELEELEQVLEAFCEPVLQGRRLRMRCRLCGKTMDEPELVSHMLSQHQEEVEGALEGSFDGSAEEAEMEALLMGLAAFAGDVGRPGSSAPKARRRKGGKKR